MHYIIFLWICRKAAAKSSSSCFSNHIIMKKSMMDKKRITKSSKKIFHRVVIKNVKMIKAIRWLIVQPWTWSPNYKIWTEKNNLLIEIKLSYSYSNRKDVILLNSILIFQSFEVPHIHTSLKLVKSKNLQISISIRRLF